jgi:hypothetical protein
MNKTLHEKAQDLEYRHHGIIKNCLDKRIEVPASLVVEVLENEIKAIGGRSWGIVSGFPNDTEQLAEFETKVVYPKTPRLHSVEGDTDIIY